VAADRRQVSPRAWVLYDGACGFCSRWVPLWKRTLETRGIGIAPLQDAWVGARLSAKGIRDEELLDDLRVLAVDPDELFAGADAYRWVFRRIGWAWPLYVLSVTPGLRRLFDWSYRTFAEHRYRFSKACHLDGGEPR
jgi:predicted DCC family thiol-disulfide oxidoreductase YuxK